jgi:hypothetical protein
MVKKSFLLMGCVFLIAVFLVAAVSPTNNTNLNLPYLETSVDKQFEKRNLLHFGIAPKNSDRFIGDISFTPSTGSKRSLPSKVSGHGIIKVNGTTYPFEFNDEIDSSVKENGWTFYHGAVEGSLVTKKGKVDAVFTLLLIPNESKSLITIGVDMIGDSASALAFGEKFEEVDQWMATKFGNGGRQ